MRLTRRMGPDYRACARGRLLRLFVWSSCLAAVLTLRPFAAAQDARPGFGEDDPRIKTSAPIFFDRVDTVRVTPFGSVSDVGMRTASAGSCEFQSTYTDADFDGPGDFSIVFGLAETEIFAASYTIAPEFFPIEIQSVEMVFAQTGAEDTVTQLELLILKGTPDQSQIVGAPIPYTLDFTTTEADAINVWIDLSANPVEVENNGTDTFSVGFRIVEHNNQTENPCTANPPANSNAFPTVDVSGVQNEAENWLFFVNCGPLACPAGWNRFEDLGFCEPGGDWVLRATWAPLDCEFSIGACCLGDGSCEEDQVDFICTGQGGRFLGENTICPEFCDGACCFSDGQCSVLTSDACEGLGGEYQTDGSDCDPDPCPDPEGACCNLGPDGDQCLEATEAACTDPKVGGAWAGGGTDCADANGNGVADECEPITGACCLPSGTCQDDVVAETCVQAGGDYKGDDTNCATEDCLGACCFGALCLGDASGFDCTDAGGTWYGPLISCGDETNPCLVDPLDGACCPADGSACQVLGGGDCSMADDTWFGPGSTCDSDFIQCDQPTGACCAAGDPCICQDDLTEEECIDAQGQWSGVNTTCTDNCETCEACCSPITGACVDLTVSDCVGFGANPQGEGTTCATTACPAVEGACCSADGTFCDILEQFECAALAGNWQGPDTICKGLDCSATGACCFINETCSELQFMACVSQGGEFLGDGTDCIPNPCGPVGCQNDEDCNDNNQCNGIETCLDEACISGMPLNCNDDDACTDDNCDAVLGCVHDATDCNDDDACTIDSCDDPAVGCIHTPIVPCCGNADVEKGEQCDPPDGETCDDNCQLIPTGACCQGETCGEGQTADQCAAGGGDYQGDETTCEPNPCAGLGACCLTDFGECIEGQTPESCPGGIGIFQGDGSTCADADCGPVAETEACCTSNGGCFDWPADLCDLLGSDPQGPGSTCENTECVVPVGACCAVDGSCSVVTEADCGAGSYQGNGTDCVAGLCCQADPDCDDGDLCNGAETCEGNVCQDGTPPADGTECNDGLFCTDTDTCSDGACLGSDDPCPGPDGDDDCAESCDEEANSCTAPDPNGAACDDGLFCTNTDTCSDGACLGSGDPCVGPDGDDDCAESCDEEANSCTASDPNDTPCDDQNACTDNDICTGGVCDGMALDCGACCLDSGNCQDGMNVDDCAGAGGTHQGIGSTCAPGSCVPAVGNDLCADAIETFAGLTDFDTTGAKTDGPEHEECKFDGQTVNDIWYIYIADCTADTVVTTCEDLGAGADYDTDLVVYDGCDCANLVLLGCNDDDPGNPCGLPLIYQSTVTVPMVAGSCYLIRVGGWQDKVKDEGIGTLLIDPQCGACCQGDTCINDQGPGECTDAGGVFQGIGSACTDSGGDIDCSITGACCTAGGGCIEMTPQACAEQSGAYEGDGITCDPDPCECGDCPTDTPVNGPNGSVGAEDLAYILGNWGPFSENPACNPECPAALVCIDNLVPNAGNEQIGAEDLAKVLGTWGPCQ